MLWKNRRASGNVVDRRGMDGRTLGIGSLIVDAIVYSLMGGNPVDYIAQNSGSL